MSISELQRYWDECSPILALMHYHFCPKQSWACLKQCSCKDTFKAEQNHIQVAPNLLRLTVHPHLIILKYIKNNLKLQDIDAFLGEALAVLGALVREHLLHSMLMSQETLLKFVVTSTYLNSINDLILPSCSILFLNVVHPNLPKEGCLNLNERNCSKIIFEQIHRNSSNIFRSNSSTF